jgi:hypothetical protein
MIHNGEYSRGLLFTKDLVHLFLEMVVGSSELKEN